jgi:hypothetical protein
MTYFPTPPDGIGAMDVIFDGRKACIVYIDKHWKPTPKDQADLMVVNFYDGGSDVYTVPHAKQ